VNQTTYPLPNLGPLLRERAKDLQTGRGFFVLRGLQPDKYTIEENIIIYAGISSYIGPVRGRQDNKLIDGVKQSQMLNHIKDLSQTSVAGNIGAPAYTTDKQVFHTDAGDIVSLFCLGTAAKGGESKLASSWRVYNELSQTRPDIIKTLSEDWIFNGCIIIQSPVPLRQLGKLTKNPQKPTRFAPTALPYPTKRIFPRTSNHSVRSPRLHWISTCPKRPKYPAHHRGPS